MIKEFSKLKIVEFTWEINFNSILLADLHSKYIINKKISIRYLVYDVYFVFISAHMIP